MINEDMLCQQCTTWWDIQMKDPFGFIHIPNGGSRNKLEAFKFKRMGVRAGVADFMIIKYDGTVCWMEFKVGKNKLSEHQKEFRDAVLKKGHQWAEIRSFDEFVNTLSAWGIYQPYGRNKCVN